MYDQRIILGILYLTYGIVKVVVGLSIMLLPHELLLKSPGLKWFAHAKEDKTLAGRMYEYALLAFGVFTIVNGIVLLQFEGAWLYHLFNEKWMHYTVYIALGLWLTIFYVLVLYTSVPISKNMEDVNHYRYLGLLGGITFLLMPPAWELFNWAVPAFHRMSTEAKGFLVGGFIIVLAIVGDMVYSHFKKQKTTVRKYIEDNAVPYMKAKIYAGAGTSKTD